MGCSSGKAPSSAPKTLLSSTNYILKEDVRLSNLSVVDENAVSLDNVRLSNLSVVDENAVSLDNFIIAMRQLTSEDRIKLEHALRSMETNAEHCEEKPSKELARGDRVKVLVNMTSDSEPSHKVDLPEGSLGTIQKIDDAGDAYIAFVGFKFSQWILKGKLHNLATQEDLASREELVVEEVPVNNLLVNSVVGDSAVSLEDLIAAIRRLDPEDRNKLEVALHSMEAKVEDSEAKPSDELFVGDRVTVLVSISSDSEPSHKVDLPEGTMGTIRRIDDAGDAYIAFVGFEFCQWILKANLHNLAAQKASTEH